MDQPTAPPPMPPPSAPPWASPPPPTIDRVKLSRDLYRALSALVDLLGPRLRLVQPVARLLTGRSVEQLLGDWTFSLLDLRDDELDAILAGAIVQAQSYRTAPTAHELGSFAAAIDHLHELVRARRGR